MMSFSITNCLDPTSLSSAPKKQAEIRRISYYDLQPNEENFYSMKELEELKAAIELAGRILSNLVVTPLTNGKYKILSGHRRHAAIGLLLAEGKEEYEFLPCAVEHIDGEGRDTQEQVLLIAANSQREKTAWDKLEEVRQMREIAKKAKEQQGLSGRVREIVAKSLHVSSSRIAKYDSILNNLIPALLEEIKADELPVSIAYELSALPADRQQAGYEFYLNHGKLPNGPAQFDVSHWNTQAVAADVFQPNTQTAAEDVFHRNTQPAAEDVFQPNTQPVAEDVFQPNTQPAAEDVFQPNTQPAANDVFQSNTQPAAEDVFHRNTQPQAGQPDVPQFSKTFPGLKPDEWSNNACCGYVIMAMEDCGFSLQDIGRVMKQLHDVMDFNSLEDAEKKFCSSPY